MLYVYVNVNPRLAMPIGTYRGAVFPWECDVPELRAKAEALLLTAEKAA